MEPYAAQVKRWPASGRHVLAQYDDDSVVLYQAYKPSIGRYAAAHQRFGGEFRYERMSWVKPNFLWMMFRSGWGTKEDQQTTLAVWVTRAGFDAMLAAAVHTKFVPEVYGSQHAWERAMRDSPVRLQWDPDHDPGGGRVERRAVQLGLAGDVLKSYGTDWIVRVEDVSPAVEAQRPHRHATERALLVTPREEVYRVRDAAVAARLGVSEFAEKAPAT